MIQYSTKNIIEYTMNSFTEFASLNTYTPSKIPQKPASIAHFSWLAA